MTSFFEGLLEHAKEAVAAHHWVAKDDTQLTIHLGDHMNIIERTTDDWWYVEFNEKFGYVPTNYIKLRLDNFIDQVNVQTRIGMEREPSKYSDEIEKCSIAYIEKNLLEDADYFATYESIKIHHEMLTDTARTKAYQDAVRSLAPFIKDKIVLDVGCGTGILSMFCAKAGAKHVYGVEASPFAFKTRKIIECNNMNGQISILHGKMEDIFLPVEKVDVIISEWMGTMLVTESMICSVLYARDRYLKGYIKQKSDALLPPLPNDDDSSSSATDGDDEEAEIIIMDEHEEKKDAENDNNDEDEDTKDDEKNDGAMAAAMQPPPLPKQLMHDMMKDRGLMMPSHCNLYFGPIDLSKHVEEKVDYFGDVYGCDMEPLREDAIELYLAHATYEIEIDAKNMLCDEGMVLKHYNMYTCTDKDDLEALEREFRFEFDRGGVFCGFAGWFDVAFNPPNGSEHEKMGIVLDTSPKCKRTHWSQTLFPLSEQIKVNKGDVVSGKVSFFRNNVSIRHYRLFVDCQIKDKTFRKMFFLWD